MTTHWELDPSPETAAAVLHGLFGWAMGRSELIEISVKLPGGKWRSQHVRAAELCSLDSMKNLAEWSREGRETYVGCVGLTEKPKYSWRRGSAAIRGHAGALWIDVDCEAPGRVGPEYYGSVDEAVAGIDDALGPVLSEASLVIGSGWGVQYWMPLREPVPGKDASRTVRALVGMLTEKTSCKIDRVWDVTRVMRMPGTWNWRGGLDPDDARPTGVLRMPGRPGGAAGRLELANVIDEIARSVGDVTGDGSPIAGDVSSTTSAIDWNVVLDALVERYGGTSGAEDSDPGARLGDWLFDIERIAHETLRWDEVLEPFGWAEVSAGPREGAAWHEWVWERPGKDLERGMSGVGGGRGERGWGAARVAERSAVVYADREELLTVYSDSLATGFHEGLRGSGARGEGAGVGVISKWRAWVDLAWHGDGDRALAGIATGEDLVGPTGETAEIGERLSEAWAREMTPVREWLESEEWRSALASLAYADAKMRAGTVPASEMDGPWNPGYEADP